jgi:hypothetical protein
LTLCGALGLAAIGCNKPPAQPAEGSASSPSVSSQLPVSLNVAMVALVNESADPIWIAAAKPPQSDKEWRSVVRAAYQMEVAGALLQIPGTGPMDAEWTGRPEWQQFARELTNVGKQAVAAAEARDLQAVTKAGDALVEVCEGCHKAFKPDIPTQKIYGELRYPLDAEPAKTD